MPFVFRVFSSLVLIFGLSSSALAQEQKNWETLTAGVGEVLRYA